jgi:hypothetical protein
MTVKLTSSVRATSLETEAVKAKLRPCATDADAVGLSVTETAPWATAGTSSTAHASTHAALRLLVVSIFLSRLARPAAESADTIAAA